MIESNNNSNRDRFVRKKSHTGQVTRVLDRDEETSGAPDVGISISDLARIFARWKYERKRGRSNVAPMLCRCCSGDTFRRVNARYESQSFVRRTVALDKTVNKRKVLKPGSD